MATDPSGPSNDSQPARRCPALAPLALALVVLAIAVFNRTQLGRTVYSSDQINIATMVLKYGHPELFPTEQGLRSLDLYPNTYIGLLNLLASQTGGTKQALFWLGTCLLVVFAAGMFVLLFETTGNAWIATALAVAALWFRASFEGQQWQVADFTAFLPRAITFAMTPWLLLACMRRLGRWQLVGVFAALGIAANYHPLSAIFLAAIFGLTLLLAGQSRLTHVAILAVSVVVFAAALAPYSLEVTHAMSAAAAARELKAGPRPSPEQIAQVRRLTPYATFPPPLATMRWVGFQMALPLLAGVGGWWVRRRQLSHRDRVAVAFLGGVLIYSVGGAATEAVVRATLGLHKSFLFMRAFHLIYLPLWVFCGWLIAELWNRQGSRQRFGAALLTVALLIPASAPEYALRWVKYKGKIPQSPSLQSDPDILSLCRWAREHTQIADSFLVPPNWSFFPLFAERRMVASGKEVGFIIYEPAVGVEAYERARAVQAAYDDPAPARLIEAAKRYGAAYVVVRDRTLPGDPAFQTGPYRVYAVGR